MIFILSLWFACLISIVDMWQLMKHTSLPLLEKCPFAEKMPKAIENAAIFLINHALKTSKLFDYVRHLMMNADKQNPPRMNSTCDYPFKVRKGGFKYSRAYYCEVIVRNACYDCILRHNFFRR